MKMYRLKPEAVPFFAEKMATGIYSEEVWENHNIDMKALEEVKPIFLTFGHEQKRETYTCGTLGGWDKDGGKFHFTVNFPSLKYQEFDKFNKGRPVREMMEKIQKQLDYFYQQFVTESNPE